MTDLLNFQVSTWEIYRPIVPLLHRALLATGTTNLVDLCAGGGGPVVQVQRLLAAQHGLRVTVQLTDKYPNLAGFRRAAEAAPGTISFSSESIDAMDVPAELDGFRTLFTSLHHFPPEAARSILADAVRQRRGIGVFEFTERNLGGLGALALSVPLTLLSTPFLRPFRLSRLLLTYLFPLVPAVYLFDGIVSTLRSYSPSELLELAESSGPGYHWEAGCLPHPRMPLAITYLIGYPVTAA